MKLPGHAQKNESQFKREEEEEEEEEDEFRSADITTDGFLVFINCRVERNRGRRKKKKLGRSIGCCWQQIKKTTATTYSSVVALWMTAIT